MLFGKTAITKLWTIILAVVIIVAIIGGATYYYIGQPPAKKEVLFGVAISQTGPYGPSGKTILDGYRLWEKDVNDRGGILGLPVRIIAYDDESNPTTTKALYERLITVDNVDFILGPYSSACATVMMPVAEKYDKVAVQPLNAAISLYTQGWNNIFLSLTAGVSNLTQQTQYLKLMQATGVKTIGVINAADNYPQSKADGFIDYCQQYNISVAYHEEIAKDATDVSGAITALKAANPDVAVFAAAEPIEFLLIKTCYELGFKPKAIFSDETLQGPLDAVAALGSEANYVFGSQMYALDYSSSVNIDFVNKFQAEYNRDPSLDEACAFGACLLLETAINGVGSYSNQDNIRNWLTTHSVQTPEGLWQVDQNLANQGIKWVPQSSMIVDQMINGTPVHIYPPANANASFVYPIP